METEHFIRLESMNLTNIFFSFRSGTDRWRFGSKYTPSKILNKYCEVFDIEPDFPKQNGGKKVTLIRGEFDKRHFSISDFGEFVFAKYFF